MLSVREGQGGVGAARQARALAGLQAAHPHVLQAESGRGVRLGLRVHVRAHAQGVAAVAVSGRSGAHSFLLALLVLLLLLLLWVDVVVRAPHWPHLAEV